MNNEIRVVLIGQQVVSGVGDGGMGFYPSQC